MTYTPRIPGKGFKKKIAKLQAENDALHIQLAETERENIAARAEKAFEKGLSAAVYALYLWDGAHAADVIAKELGYQSAKDLAEKAQDDALLGAIAALEGGAA